MSRIGYCNGCAKFEVDDIKSFYKKNDSELILSEIVFKKSPIKSLIFIFILLGIHYVTISKSLTYIKQIKNANSTIYFCLTIIVI